jgi:hypothetical protein
MLRSRAIRDRDFRLCLARLLFPTCISSARTVILYVAPYKPCSWVGRHRQAAGPDVSPMAAMCPSPHQPGQRSTGHGAPISGDTTSIFKCISCSNFFNPPQSIAFVRIFAQKKNAGEYIAGYLIHLNKNKPNENEKHHKTGAN